ncbi:MAG: phosphotransferase enzyme family protein [Bacteroidota bacterium]
MTTPLPHSLTDLLTSGLGDSESKLITDGLIHRTYRLKTGTTNYLLQSVNKNIFSYPKGLIDNHLILFDHFLAPDTPFTHPLAQPLLFPNRDWLFQDESGNTWRLCEYIEGSCTRSGVEDAAQAYALADFFARFTRHASTLDSSNWHIPLPNFHDLEARFSQWELAIRNDPAKRKKDLLALIEELNGRQVYVNFYSGMRQNPNFPLRMMHHDAKLSNVLIDAQTDQWLCPIDLDTVMPGYFFSDLGDMIRSLCNTAPREDSPASDISFRADIYEALLQGYRIGMSGTLSRQEEEQLDMAGPLITYMQTLRFLTDHVNGDLYYQIDHPGQNLERALNQFTLLKKMEAYLKEKGRL